MFENKEVTLYVTNNVNWFKTVNTTTTGLGSTLFQVLGRVEDTLDLSKENN